MTEYFPPYRSAAHVYGDNPESIITLMASHYMGNHPPMPFQWRTFDETGISCARKAIYHFDFATRFPYASTGDRVLAIGELWCPSAKNSVFHVW